MLRFFRINDPFRILVVPFVMLVIRLPFYLTEEIASTADARLLLLGEKIASGDWLFLDIYTYEAPLTALFYGLIVFIFGKSIWALHILSFITVSIQVLLFNYIIGSNKATENTSNLPGLFYGILLSLLPAGYSLSSMILGMTFLLLALNFVFNHLEFRVKRDEKILITGIYLGIATLFDIGYIFFLPAVIVLFILFTNTLFRRYIQLIYGFLLPYFAFFVAFLLKGESTAFLNYLWKWQWIAANPAFGWDLFLSILTAITLIPLFLVMQRGRFTSFQSTLLVAMLIWLVFGIISVVVMGPSHPFSTLPILPVTAFFLMHLFGAMRPGFWTGIFFIIFIGAAIFGGLSRWYFTSGDKPVDYHRAIMTKPGFPEGSSYVIISGTSEFPMSYSVVSPYFDTEITTPFFSEVDYHSISECEKISTIYKPDIIFDQDRKLSEIVRRIPSFSNNYKSEDDGRVYRRISN